MKRLAPVILAVVAALAVPASALAIPARVGSSHASPHPAKPSAIGQCGLPSVAPLWMDFGTPALQQVFARPGVILAVSTGEFPARVRETGAKTVYWDMYLNKRVGTPTAPTEQATIPERANRLFEFASAQTGCDAPVIVLNELFGASLETPWSATNTRYRANALVFVRTLAARGARPLLLVSSAPYSGSADAADWWREASRYADLVPEVYFGAPSLWKQGPILAGRRLRTSMRRAVANFRQLGISASKLGIVLGFQSRVGSGGREGLATPAWFEVVKWQALAARQVARETGLGSVLSWGWATYGNTAADLDKEAAACVYLWTRESSLCDGPAVAGEGFDASLTEGQIQLRAGEQCVAWQRKIDSGTLATLRRVTGDREVAFTTLLARLAESRYEPVSSHAVLIAERTVVAVSFRGSPTAYRAALAAAGATVAVARGVLADELRRLRIEARLRARPPSAREVSAFYISYPDLLTRAVEATPAPWWLGGRSRGLAFAALAPAQVFSMATGARTLRALDGNYAVRIGEVRPLGTIPFAEARAPIASALAAFARRTAFESWTLARQDSALRSAVCRRDDLPAPGTIRLTGYLPFLALAGS